MARQLARFLRDRREDLRPATLACPGAAAPYPGTAAGGSRPAATCPSSTTPGWSRPRAPPVIADTRQPRRRAAALQAERDHLFRLAGVPPAAAGRYPDGSGRTWPTLLRPDAGQPGLVTAAGLRRDRLEPARRSPLRATHRRGAEPGAAALPEPRPGPDDSTTRSSGRSRWRGCGAPAARYPRDIRIADLLGELRAGSGEFNELWATNPVRAPGHRAKTIAHPELGNRRVNCDILAVPDDDQQVVFITADPGSASARALRHLALSSGARQQETMPGRRPESRELRSPFAGVSGAAGLTLWRGDATDRSEAGAVSAAPTGRSRRRTSGCRERGGTARPPR